MSRNSEAAPQTPAISLQKIDSRDVNITTNHYQEITTNHDREQIASGRYWMLPLLPLAVLVAAFVYHLPGSGWQMGCYLVPGILALISSSAFPAIKGNWRWIALSATVILAVTSGVQLVWALDHGDIDVTGRVHQSSDQPLAEGRTQTLTVDIPTQRSSLAISFRLSEHHREQMCVPHTRIQVNTRHGYAAAPLMDGQVRVAEYEAATIVLHRGRTEVELNVTVVTDKGCEVDLQVDKAILTDR
ncbi:hypothetical protein [Nocardia lijiangensis]|uniref:hypothetical protein n=1 Tax=Nocardia lijiangensis TaxID=299618 RepID=UPI00082D4FE8|nr:hypothetical protein [Nocardia lijiangensis]